MEESKKLLILRILLIIAAILLIINIIPNIGQSNLSISTILYPIIAVVLIVIAIKIEDIPMREYILLILGIVILILGFAFNHGMGLVGVLIAAILVILAGIIDMAIKT